MYSPCRTVKNIPLLKRKWVSLIFSFMVTRQRATLSVLFVLSLLNCFVTAEQFTLGGRREPLPCAPASTSPNGYERAAAVCLRLPSVTTSWNATPTAVTCLRGVSTSVRCEFWRPYSLNAISQVFANKTYAYYDAPFYDFSLNIDVNFSIDPLPPHQLSEKAHHPVKI